MDCKKHPDHTHAHGPDCGHTRVRHDDHEGYLHDGHLHFQKAPGEVEEHSFAVSDANPDGCHPMNGACNGHVHGPGCGHEAVPHGDHTDYLVDGRLHHAHDGHCDDHGAIEVVR